MDYSISFDRRDFAGRLLVGDYLWTIERLDWRSVGGPWSGRLLANARQGGGTLSKLWALVELLRCGITISDQAPAWWGYVSAVEIHAPTRAGKRGAMVRAELDTMWNKGRVEYFSYNPAVPDGDRSYTTVSQVTDSITNYGYKERLFRTTTLMTAAQAANFLASTLARYGQPVVQMKLEDGNSLAAGGYYAILELRGWWETLDWRFYSDSRGKLGHTTAGYQFQIGANSTQQKWAQSFTVGADAWTATELWIKAMKAGSPSDNLRVDLCADSGGVPGVSLAYGVIDPGIIGNDAAEWQKVSLGTPYAMAANTRYWVVVSRAGAVNASHYFTVNVHLNTNPAESIYYWNGVTWTQYVDADMGHVVIGTVDGSEQITRILHPVNGCGQFLAGSRIESTIGVQGIPYRDGSTRGRQEIEQHLKTGTSAGRRLLARVEPDRIVRVFAQPLVSSAVLIVGDNGQIVRRDMGALQMSEWPAGQWVKLGAMASAGTLPGFDGAVFVEACSWLPADGFHLLEE